VVQCRYLQVGVAGIAERVTKVEVVEHKLNALRVDAPETELTRDVRGIRVRVQRRVERSAGGLLTAVLHPTP